MIFKRAKLRTDSFTSLIANGVTVHGDILFKDTIKIDGTIIGSVKLDDQTTDHGACDGTVIIAMNGKVYDGDIRATNVVIAGCHGRHNLTNKPEKTYEVWAEDTLRIEATAQLRNLVLHYRNLEVATGAKLVDCQLKHLDLPQSGEAA